MDEKQKPDVYHRKVRSFVRREGRLTPGQEKALTQQWEHFGLELHDGMIDLDTCFNQPAPCVFEIGFGMGGSLLENAKANPDVNYIGIEVHRPGVGMLLKGMAEDGIQNIRIYQEDAVEVINQCIPNQSLAGIQVFFPDPWPKKKHHKRRIIQAAFVKLLATKVTAEGWLHCATDWQPYAEWMMEVLSASPEWVNRYGHENYAPRPKSRPLTKFERRGQRLGHGVWDLIFDRATA